MDSKDKFKNIIFKDVVFQHDEWVDFSSKWKPIAVPKNEFIIKKGTVEKYLYFVVDGVLRAFHIKDGEEICVGFSYTNDFSGGYDSFITGGPTRFYIQALNPVNLLRISRDDLDALYDKHKIVERWGRLFNEKLLLGKGLREVAILAYSAEERYRRLMTQSPHCLQLIPQKYLASYLAMTPETFSRLRKKVKL